MKSASIPSIRVEPELREAAEGVLEEGETLSSFVEESVRFCIARRRCQREFIARALASHENARQTGEYWSADEVLGDLDELLRRSEEARGPEE